MAIGYQAKASGSYAAAIGYSNISQGYSSFSAGYDNTVTGDMSIALGALCTASGLNSVSRTSVAIGYQTTASGGGDIAIGDRSDTRGIYGKLAHASGFAGGAGTAQQGQIVLYGATTDATAKVLSSGYSPSVAADATNQVILPNNSAYSFSGTIVARQQAADGTACAAWKVEGLIRREGSAGTTTLVGSTVTAISNTPSWGMALSADTTNGGLKIEATGAASTDIRWVATIHTSEVTYA